ncbi:Extracellular metalloproteinase [Grifola frondosa]|uniref:Extracellular metalloproteinase n=1 Tax=Grifola frondosa TaxID=5627 RepID=A0A1C7MCQ6_GRIFR|nr:Extracellular metalloproteinase [Grifola frondosa]
MRRLIVAAIAAAGLAGVVAHDSNHVSRRKTLSFGPILPHATYHTEPIQPLSAVNVQNDPLEVAKLFVQDITSGLSPASTFAIRKDSYTDTATGVTHVYVRQYLHGVEVADGDINVNVKDGVVLSYGDSFYRGAELDAFIPAYARGVPDAHAEYCSNLEREMSTRFDQYWDQVEAKRPQGDSDEEALASEVYGILPYLYDWNCEHVETPFAMPENAEFAQAENYNSGDVTRALLQFMIAATPNKDLADDLIANPAKYLQKMSATWEANFADEHATVQVHGAPDTVNPVKGRIAFVQVPHGDTTALELVWKFEVEMQDNWYEAAVSTEMPHRIVSVVDWASDSPMPVVAPVPKQRANGTYNVFAWGINDPSVGKRSIQDENWDHLASPSGWHSLPYENDPASAHIRVKGTKFRNTATTWGNNVFAHENWEGRNNWESNYRPDAGVSMKFDFAYKPKQTDSSADALDEAHKYINASVTQLFYTSNLVHDLYYRYGFTEVAGNFQQYNFGRGGEENDAVIANAQDGSGYNNANFMTPPDGQNGRCRMYLWNTANPYRDGDLEAGIVIHELSHGLSTRLTGGPANSGCLGWGESGGMGEGWGDFLATTIRSNKEYSDYAMGAWAANRPTGIRNYVYSINETTNPSTYKTLDKPGYWGVHAIGEVWAQILWVVEQRLIEKHGFVDDLFPPKPSEDGVVPEGDFYRKAEYTSTGERKPLIPKHGNSLIVQLVLDGMKLQPCRPSFFDARDAIIAADKTLTGGENFCDLWEGFASRGLGPDSKVDGRTPWGGGIRTDDYKLPTVCKKQQVPEKPVPTPGDDDDDEDWSWIYWISAKASSISIKLTGLY